MRMLIVAFLQGCTAEPGWRFPDVSEAPPLLGPAGPAVAFADTDLFRICGFLDAGPADRHDVHNGVYPWRGYGVMPYARDIGEGGVAVFDLSDPCAATVVGQADAPSMRETHTAAFVHLSEGPAAGDWMVATDVLGVQFWRMDDPTAPVLAHRMQLPGVTFLAGSYPRTVHSVSWQYPWLYVAAADNGLFVVDATDPMAPVLVDQVILDPPLRAGFVYAMGGHLFLAGSEESEAVVLDISRPDQVQPVPGGRFALADADGVPREAYSGNIAGDWALFARSEGGSGPIIYDISDPSAPTYVADLNTAGNGGYVFHDEGYLFIGESDVARIIDAATLEVVGEIRMANPDTEAQPDLDTLMPYGNVALLSADEDAPDGQATAAVPWRAEPDGEGPVVLRVDPVDGAVDVAPTMRLGVALSEFVEPTSAFEGSIRLYDADGNAIRGVASAREAIAHYTPLAPLLPGTYTAEVVAGGLRDANDNPITQTVTWSFTVR